MRNRLSLAFLFSGALLVACSDDDSFIQRPSGGLPAEVADKAELETYECSMDVIGEKVYVVDLGENYECDGDEWFRSYDQPKSSSSAKSSSSVTPKSSSSAKSSSSVTPKSSGATGEASPCSALPGGVCDYDTLTDTRDGQTYKTVTIGTQTWMAENLNYAYTGVPYNYSGYTSDSTSWCYENDPANCAKYGRLYTWAAAMDSSGTWSTNGKGCGYGSECSPTGTIRGICPEGWHVLYAAFAPRAGTYRTPRNGIRCSRRWAVYPQPVGSSSPLAAGINMKAKAATVRILSGSRRCLPAAGATMGITTTRAITRSSGVLRRNLATARTTCACATTSTARAWAATLRISGILFVVSRTDFCPGF